MLQTCSEQQHIRQLAIEAGKHSERISDLEDHRKRQNGSMDRIEDKISKVDDHINSLVKAIMLGSLTLIGTFLVGVLTLLIQLG